MEHATQSMRSAFSEINSHEDFECAWKKFVSLFHENHDPSLIADEPTLLADKLNDDGLANAFLASIAAYLCQIYSLKQPAWPDHHCRVKKTPWFASDSPELKNRYLRLSPAAFRLRNLFVSADALTRA